MSYAIWTFAVMYLLGVLLYVTILEAADEEADPNAALRTAFLWPYVAVMVTIERMMYGDKDE